MAGVYIHIPFCTQKCGYCDFYSIIRLKDKSEFIDALVKEIGLRAGEVDEKIKTIYFGGGTPSLLKKEELVIIFNALKEVYDFSFLEEITIEVNPDDITTEYLGDLKEIGFNRLSMGIQSFNDRILTYMNRRHGAEEAKIAVQLAKIAGFTNMSIDLIYGIPKMTDQEWKHTIDTAIELDVIHISAYHLTFEPGTPFYKNLKRNIVSEIDDKESVSQYNTLITKLTSAKFNDYEISNFCKEGFESKHNSNYWTGNSYVGLGPSAHSYTNNRRRWNVSDLKKYITNISQDKVFYETETLTEKDLYNELIMLGLRTSKGVYLNSMNNFSAIFMDEFKQIKQKNIKAKKLIEEQGYLKVRRESKFLTDQIISDFFIV
ncbi:radical SAM family heme chaperone HemW [Labilibacter marinus]|uniref:radical SAM family heme chaperone HemW n=1 Tax=Labilibacter marinus TaxID=1477105 RepID=UPI000833EABF|nr:radical SAM family heme chaperone HemW [Labilibacter marinus]